MKAVAGLIGPLLGLPFLMIGFGIMAIGMVAIWIGCVLFRWSILEGDRDFPEIIRAASDDQ